MRYLIILFFFISANQLFSQAVDSVQANWLYNKALSLDSFVRENPNKQTSNFNPQDTSSLPIGIVKEISGTKYIICIDSAFFTPQGAYFNVYMAMHFPGAEKPIGFYAQGIQFNPQGVIVSNGARLKLISQIAVPLGPKVTALFKNDGNNFIEWDCNGYKQAGISMDFIFSGDMLVNANSPSEPVKASMQSVVSDLKNITFSLSQMTPFRVKHAEDFIFSLSNIVIDRSEFTTPNGVTLPSQILQNYNGDINLWKGFYAQNATITLPDKLSGGNQNTQIYASNLIIDDAGVSGSFGANNVFALGAGSMGASGSNGKWGFSLDNIQVNLVCNHVTGGSLAGSIAVAPLDDHTMAYSATVTENPNSDRLNYCFTLSPGNAPITVSAFKSKLTLNQSSQFTVQTVNDRFVPSAVLNGSWTVDFTKAKVKGISFQNLSVGTTAPYITSGYFALVGSNPDSNSCIRFPISISSIGMNLTPQNQLAFTVGVGLNIGDSTNGFGVNTTLRIKTVRQPNNAGQERIQFDQLAVDDIAINIQTTPFHLQGVIAIKNDDPVFGDLFYGSMSLKIPSIIDNPILISAGFGKMPDYKYWFTDAGLPVNIPISPTLKITSLYGGVQNRVVSTLNDQQQINRAAGVLSMTPSTVIPFTPDQNQGLRFRAGVALQNTVEKVFNGEAMLAIAFNPSGGFQSIDFDGQAYMMVKRDQRSNSNAKKISGNVHVGYDNANKIFDAGMNAAIIFPGTITGNLNVSLHVDQNDWYFWLNRPSTRANLNLVNMFYVNTYFMIGTIIDPIPPPPSYVTNIVGGGNLQSVDLNAAGNGSGFATGIQFGVYFNGEFPKTTEWRGYVTLNVGGGFDLMLFNAENVHCSGSSDPVGVNGYYAMGQVYAYLGGSFGARKYKENGDLKNEYPIGSLQLAALLQGRLPKPTFVYGAVGLQASILGIIDFTFTADVELGNNCPLVGL